MNGRHYSLADRLLMDLQAGLSRSMPQPQQPGDNAAVEASDENGLSEAERRHAAGLMRVNHAGEIAAQALYRGQAATARDPVVREHMKQAAAEEEAHLEWCEQRVRELGEQPSRLAPLWHAGSFAIGAVAGLVSDRVSLGFVAETERQVVDHLSDHLEKLPETDTTSREIVERMREDEARHGEDAMAAGGTELPRPVRDAMKLASRIMTRAAYWF